MLMDLGQDRQLCILEELSGGGSVAVAVGLIYAVAVDVSDM